MSSGPNPPGEMRLLSGGEATPPIPAGAAAAVNTVSLRQLAELPKDELHALAEEFGLEPARYRSPQALVAAIGERRQLIGALDREAMLDVIRWGRRPVPINASHEQLALEIVKIKAMRFEGLTQRGLEALARLRGIDVLPADDVPSVIKKLKKKEGFWSMVNRKRRSWLGSIVSNILGENDQANEYQFLPPQDSAASGGAPAGAAAAGAAGTPQRSIKDDIEESGLFGGIAARVKKSADQYLKQKLDEIESRIDRKLDEIDRRLAEWRDKEIANRLRILKITLWASVIVAVASLIYTYAKVHFWDAAPKTPPRQTVPTQTAPTQTAPTQTGPTQTAPTQTAPTQTGPTQRS